MKTLIYLCLKFLLSSWPLLSLPIFKSKSLSVLADNDSDLMLDIFSYTLTIKNIITKAWAVMILLYNWLSAINWTPGLDSSNLIKTEKAVPIKPDNKAKIRYKTPISFAFDE